MIKCTRYSLLDSEQCLITELAMSTVICNLDNASIARARFGLADSVATIMGKILSMNP